MARYKILIADDDKDLVTLLRERIENDGFDTVCAFEGVRVVETAVKEHPDLIILDWLMPAGKAPYVLKGLRNNNETRHIPVIILTGIMENDMEKTAKDFGAKAFFRKPYEYREVILKIKELLKWKEVMSRV